MSRVIALFLVLVFCFSSADVNAGQDRQRRIIVPDRIDDGSSGSRATLEAGSNISGGLNWVAVDTMGNAFGPASRGVKPMAYDSATGVVGIVYRAATSYGATTGQLWYSMSLDGAQTWQRVGALNSGVPNFLRYPSGTIANPTKSSDTADAFFLWAAPLLTPTAFGHMAYGVDFPLGTGAGIGFEVVRDSTFWSNVQLWTAGADINMAIYRYTTARPIGDLYRLHTTTDFSSLTDGVPSTWVGATNFNGEFGLEIAGTHRNGMEYMGKWGPFTGDPNWQVVDNVGYSTSTDGGLTWSSWVRPQPDWRSAAGLPAHQDFWSYGGPGAYSKEMVVDANGRVHFFAVTTDTLTNQRSVIEIYQTGSGWEGKLITDDLKESTALNYPGAIGGSLNQMGNHLNAAITTTGDVMALVWLDAAVQGDILPDIWFSWRRITDAQWTTPVNLTQTPSMAELLLHAAPTLRTDANGWTIFLGRCYESGVTSYPPESINRTVFYATSYSWGPTSVGDGTRPQAFRLAQNYPNPFNPATTIRFSLPEAGDVTLRVHNMLGQEVSNILNTRMEAGAHEVSFDAGNLPSGVYFYTLRAGQHVETKRMVLMK
jgi:hypothetical protein